MQTEDTYRPGDVVNGHRLNDDGTAWEPVESAGPIGSPTPEPVPAPAGNWFARHKVLTGVAAAGALIVAAAAFGGGGEEAPATQDTATDAANTEQPPAPEPEPQPATFAPISYTGSGDTIQSIEIPDTPASHVMVTITHSGSSNIAVWSVDENLDEDELLVNEIGSYSGTNILPADSAALSIEADGQWTVTIEPISNAPTFSDTYTGSGDSVVIYMGDKGVADLAHTGDGNFAVWAYPEDGRSDLLVNEIGSYAGQSIMPGGPTVLVVGADGDWSATVQ